MCLYISEVCSSFIQGCEAWKMTTTFAKMINCFNSRCLSMIIGKKFNMTTSNPDFNLLIDAISKRRLRFEAHILRMSPDRLLRRPLMTYMNSHPCPHGSLLHNCEEISFDQITRKAQNRRACDQFINFTCP